MSIKATENQTVIMTLLFDENIVYWDRSVINLSQKNFI